MKRKWWVVFFRKQIGRLRWLVPDALFFPSSKSVTLSDDFSVNSFFTSPVLKVLNSVGLCMINFDWYQQRIALAGRCDVNWVAHIPLKGAGVCMPGACWQISLSVTPFILYQTFDSFLEDTLGKTSRFIGFWNMDFLLYL